MKRNKRKPNTNHVFLEHGKDSDSYLRVSCDGSWTTLKLSDCYRSITYEFGARGDTRGKRKIAKLKAVIDDLHDYIHEEGKYAPLEDK